MSIVIEGEEHINASITEVWSALNDPEILQICIPGCETLTKASDTKMSAIIVLKVGPIKARFSGAVELTDLNPPYSCLIRGEGKGGVAGFAKGHADVNLRQVAPNVTVLTYAAKADVGGKIAQLGSRLVTSTVRKLTDQFFATLKLQLNGPDSL